MCNNVNRNYCIVCNQCHGRKVVFFTLNYNLVNLLGNALRNGKQKISRLKALHKVGRRRPA